MRQFHRFFTRPAGAVGARREYVVYDTEEPVLKLVKEANPAPHESSNVTDLVVIWGECVEFKPAKWVESYQIVGSTD